MIENSLENLFEIRKPIIGMIHLAGDNRKEKVRRALNELIIYEEEGIDGVIIEDYHGSIDDVYETLKESDKLNFKIVRGINILGNPYLGFNYADKFGAKFIQFDSVQTKDLNLFSYEYLRKKYSNIFVLGGIGFKYIKPTENKLEFDLEEGKSRCDAIVTTGAGTGIETPLEKLKKFKNYLKNFPLIIGAGLNSVNAYKQLEIADGAIVGSYFKKNSNTLFPIKREKVRTLMSVVNEARN